MTRPRKENKNAKTAFALLRLSFYILFFFMHNRIRTWVLEFCRALVKEFRYGVVGNISACHADARGSIPRFGVPFFFVFYVLFIFIFFARLF